MYGLSLSFNIVGFSSPLLPCRLVDLRRGLIYSENFQHSSLTPFPLPATIQTALLRPIRLSITWSAR